jgi:hypothetical protein
MVKGFYLQFLLHEIKGDKWQSFEKRNYIFDVSLKKLITMQICNEKGQIVPVLY